jgi:hypothetical protein
MNVIQKCHLCHVFTQKMCAHPTPLHPMVVIGPFAKWGIDFMTCKPASTNGHVVTPLWLFTSLISGLKLFLHIPMMSLQELCSYSITSYLGLESPKLLLLITSHIFATI